jgi:acetyl esterase/lipase
LLFNLASFAQGDETVHLWPNKVPNEIGSKHEPVQTPDTSRNVIRITNITDPKLIVFKPKDLINNGASIIISPGGSYKYLSINIEGYEIAEWFNELGFTAFVLEYRTPDNRIGALNDIQRSIRIVRSKASSWKIHPNKIGVIGFSAGGNLSAVASTNFNRETYTKIDEIDELSSRPDFALLLYPFSMDNGKNNSLSPNLLIDKNTPPMFIFGTADDKYANGFLVMTKALRDAQVSVELHMIPKGGHGYGMRKENVAGRTWPALAENWLKNILKD